MLIDKLKEIWDKDNKPFFIGKNKSFSFKDLKEIEIQGLKSIKRGDVVALIGDFDPESIITFLMLLDMGMIVVPLTEETSKQHSYFFQESKTQYVFKKNKLYKTISQSQFDHKLLNSLRAKKHPGLILFTTGTTGNPKAILHDFIPFFNRYKTPRPSLKALSFLVFDHIGGINTLLHILFNKGTVVSIKERSVENVFELCKKFSIELLPTTPTFLRLITLYPNFDELFPKSIKIISYGTERLDEPTLKILCKKLPHIDFRQTYGMSELGILRVKSLSRDSLYMKIGGEGVEIKVSENLLFIRAKNRMLGYLNAENPFDKDEWYCTKDIVKAKENNYLKITGRESDVINVGGLKFMPSEVEKVCLNFPGVKYVKAYSRENPITGEHVELTVEQTKDNFNKELFLKYLKENLSKHMRPIKIRYEALNLSHRFKKI